MPDQRYDDELLRRLRNEIPIARLIQHLRWPCKTRDGKFVFLCPRCQETESAVNPEPIWDVASTAKPTSIRSTSRSLPGKCEFRHAVEHLIPLLPTDTHVQRPSPRTG